MTSSSNWKSATGSTVSATGDFKRVDEAYGMLAEKGGPNSAAHDPITWRDRSAKGGTGPAIALLRRLAAALDAGVDLTAGHGLGSVWIGIG